MISNHVSLKNAPLKSLSVFFGLLIAWFLVSLALPLYAVDWLVSQPELADGRIEMTILLTWTIAVGATLLLNRLLRNSFVLKHVCWADSYMETLPYPLRGER